MAKQVFVETKKVTLSQVVEDLKSGMTKWKKDDIGFGSIEGKYNLQMNEALELFHNPKIKHREHTIPTFVIIDDLPDETTTAPEVTVPEPIQAQVEVRKQEIPPVAAKQIPAPRPVVTQIKQASSNDNLQVAF
jgi:hypothetical protein